MSPPFSASTELKLVGEASKYSHTSDHSAILHCGQELRLHFADVAGFVLGSHLFDPSLHWTVLVISPSPQVTVH